MEMRLDTRLEVLNPYKTKASVHLEFLGNGITMSNILIRKNGQDKWALTMPLTVNDVSKRPVLTFQGDLKKTIFAALQEDNAYLRMKKESKYQNSRVFRADFSEQIIASSVM